MIDFLESDDVFAWKFGIVLLIFVEPNYWDFSLRGPNTVTSTRRLLAVIGSTPLGSKSAESLEQTFFID